MIHCHIRADPVTGPLDTEEPVMVATRYDSPFSDLIPMPHVSLFEPFSFLGRSEWPAETGMAGLVIGLGWERGARKV